MAKRLFLVNKEFYIFKTFTLEYAIGRATQVDMIFIRSYKTFNAILEGGFKTFPGHRQVGKTEYYVQDQKTNREIQRSIPWSETMVSGQHIKYIF